MTFPVDSWRAFLACDGVSSLFPLPTLYYLAATDLNVVLVSNADGSFVNWDLGSDYSLTGAGSIGEGELQVLTGPPSAGFTIVVIRDTDRSQQSVWNENDGFPAKETEHAFDRLAASAMEMRGRERLNLRGAQREPDLNPVPSVPARANKVLGFDATGQPVALDPSTLGGGTGSLAKRNVLGVAADYVVSAADDLGYVELDCTAETRAVLFDASDSDIPDTTQCTFARAAGGNPWSVYNGAAVAGEPVAVINDDTPTTFRKVGNAVKRV